jgi:prepilin-type N-terminal cleavage/methylation domain-containing protein
MNIRKQQGFTIIEVVLVLAIAGLIFLMVFIALPTLQRNQRDTQRRDDVARMKAQISQYQANNKGVIPTNTAAVGCTTVAGNIGAFIDNYMTTGGATFNDPDGTAYKTRCQLVATVPANTGEWRYVTGNVCGATEGTLTAASTRDYVIQMKLEGSGIACVDSKN